MSEKTRNKATHKPAAVEEWDSISRFRDAELLRRNELDDLEPRWSNDRRVRFMLLILIPGLKAAMAENFLLFVTESGTGL